MRERAPVFCTVLVVLMLVWHPTGSRGAQLPDQVARWEPLVSSIWPADQVANVMAVIECESYGDPATAYREEWGQDSVGLMQVNEGWLTGWGQPELAVKSHDGAPVDLSDPAANLQAALWIMEPGRLVPMGLRPQSRDPVMGRRIAKHGTYSGYQKHHREARNRVPTA